MSFSYCMLTCGKCGHQADMFDFCATPVYGALPPGQYQCPGCGTAFKVQAAGELRILTAPDGEVMAFREKTEVVAIGARL